MTTHTDVAATSRPRWIDGERRTKQLAVVMIVKNEARNLPSLLASIADLADEVVIADTGSTDGTLALCRQWGVNLLRVPWRNDFAFARNRSLEAATARYLLRLDADEELPDQTLRELTRLRDEVLPVSNGVAYDLVVANRNPSGVVTRHLETRIFPRSSEIRFRGSIHEEVVSSLERAGIPRLNLTAEIHHFGYEDRATTLEKNRRNEGLLRSALRSNPHDVHLLVHLAFAVAGRNEAAEAETILSSAMELAVERGDLPAHLRAELHTQRAMLRRACARDAVARYDLERARELAPGWAVPDAMLAEMAVLDEEWDAAHAAVTRAREGEFVAGTFAFPLQRLRSNIELLAGLIAQRSGKTAEAETLFAAAIGLDADSIEARVALGQSLVDRRAWAEALAVLEPAGENEQAVGRFVDLASLIAVARFGAGDASGAAACLVPLLDVFSQRLGGRSDVHPLELAEATLRSGYPHAARNMMKLAQMAA